VEIEMHVERANRSDLVVNALPDGSKVIVDSGNDKVFALNATAGAAWDACGSTATLSEVTANMKRTLQAGVSEDLAEQAILSLQEHNLVIASGASAGTSRRQVLATLGAIALPLVVSMTMSDQKAYAHDAGSQSAGHDHDRHEWHDRHNGHDWHHGQE
jgi:hypothetical protein